MGHEDGAGVHQGVGDGDDCDGVPSAGDPHAVPLGDAQGAAVVLMHQHRGFGCVQVVVPHFELHRWSPRYPRPSYNMELARQEPCLAQCSLPSAVTFSEPR